MKLNRFNYLMTQGVKNIFTHGFMSFASITIIIACLLIMGSFSLLTLNIDANIDRLQNQNEVIAYVDETLSEDGPGPSSPRSPRCRMSPRSNSSRAIRPCRRSG